MFCTKLNYTRGSQGSEIEGRAQLDEGNEEEEATAEEGGEAAGGKQEEGGAGKRNHKLEWQKEEKMRRFKCRQLPWAATGKLQLQLQPQHSNNNLFKRRRQQQQQQQQFYGICCLAFC